MTYLGRVTVFVCNFCDKVDTCNDGFPPDWCWTKVDHKIHHACAECRKQLPVKAQHNQDKDIKAERTIVFETLILKSGNKP